MENHKGEDEIDGNNTDTEEKKVDEKKIGDFDNIISRIWDNYDDDGSGKIKELEFKKFIDDLCDADEEGYLKRKKKELRKLLDYNGDGDLEKDELLRIYNEYEENGQKKAKKIKNELKEFELKGY